MDRGRVMEGREGCEMGGEEIEYTRELMFSRNDFWGTMFGEYRFHGWTGPETAHFQYQKLGRPHCKFQSVL